VDIDPESLPVKERYALLTSFIQPRPIAWVSTQDGEGRLNLAPFSFFTGVTANPMTLCFAPARTKEGRKKDTLLNIEETGEFVVSIVTEETARKAVETSAEWPRGVSEFEKAGLTPAPSARVKPPRVRESPVSLECELSRLVSVSEGPIGGTLVLGRVVFVHAEGALSHEALKTVGRLEGDWYAPVREAFRLPRPRL